MAAAMHDLVEAARRWLARRAAAGPMLALVMLMAQPAAGATASAPAGKSLPQQELDALLAPVALFPDPLLAQVLMAATYPLRIGF